MPQLQRDVVVQRTHRAGGRKGFDPVTDAQGVTTPGVDVRLTPAQEARVKDVFCRDLTATVGFEALW